MSSIMRARSALTGRGEGAEVIGGSSRAEGCWTFNARDRMPRASPLTAHPLTATPKNHRPRRAESRESGFVLCPISAICEQQLRSPKLGVGRVEDRVITVERGLQGLAAKWISSKRKVDEHRQETKAHYTALRRQ